MTTVAEFLSSYELIKQESKLTLKQIGVAIKLEEEEQLLEAILAYEESLKLIDTVFSIKVGLPEDTKEIEVEWLDACTIIQKLRDGRAEVKYRLDVLKRQQAPVDCDAKKAQENENDLGELQSKKKSKFLEDTAAYNETLNVQDNTAFLHNMSEADLYEHIEEVPQPGRDKSLEISRYIVAGADFIAKCLVKGAEKTGEVMVKSTPYIISKIDPVLENPPTISKSMQTTVDVAKTVTTAAVDVTTWVAGNVGSASVAIGKFLTPHVQHHGSNLLQKAYGYDQQKANSIMDGTFTLAAGAVEGFSTIADGVEKSAAILGTNLSENSVKIIEHKYGSDAGFVAADTFDTLGNAFVVSRNMNYMLPKGIAKKMVKKAGIAVIDEYKQNYNLQNQYVAAGTLYPDLKALRESTENNEILPNL